jgi:DNA-binding response OmpR family regulator
MVEDDPRIRSSVRLALESADFSVTECHTGEDALELLKHENPDLVLIDIMLPGIDGFEVCRRLRETSDVPVIMVTARNGKEDTILGLEAGADDYVTKPFDTDESCARIRALLRRATNAYATPHGWRTTHRTFGDLEIRPDEGRVLRAGSEVKLTKTEFRLLCELAAAPDKVFSRETLLDRVWGYGYFGDGRLVDVHVRRLRMKIEPDPGNPRYVVTVRGLGYRLDN